MRYVHPHEDDITGPDVIESSVYHIASGSVLYEGDLIECMKVYPRIRPQRIGIVKKSEVLVQITLCRDIILIVIIQASRPPLIHESHLYPYQVLYILFPEQSRNKPKYNYFPQTYWDRLCCL